MPAVTQAEAVARLTKAVEENLDAYDLLEVNNEVFPDSRTTIEEVQRDPQPFVERLVKHLKGLDVEWIVHLWPVICPRDRRVWYNEEDDRIYYNEDIEYLSAY